MWEITNRGDQEARALADRHYNRQSRGSPHFVPPGYCLVLFAKSETDNAVWVSSKQIYPKHAWPEAVVNTLFRNESSYLSSSLIREAVALTKEKFGESPIITFVDPSKVKTKRPGWCYFKAGFGFIGYTKGGLWVFRYGG